MVENQVSLWFNDSAWIQKTEERLLASAIFRLSFPKRGQNYCVKETLLNFVPQFPR